MNYTYWYAIIGWSSGAAPGSAPPASPPAWGSGLLESSLRVVVEGELAAVVSDWLRPSIKRATDTVDPDLVWQHERVIERIMASAAVLPVRFGTILADDERVRGVLRQRQASMLADLRQVAGCVEMGLRVLWEPPAPGALQAVAGMAKGASGAAASQTGGAEPTPGARYLQQRAAEEQARRAVQEQGRALANQLCVALRGLTVDYRQSVLQTERMLLNGAYLVRRGEVDAFMAAIERLRARYGDLAFLCTGPWPPYHFVSA